MTLTNSVGTARAVAECLGVEQAVAAHRQEHGLKPLIGEIGHRGVGAVFFPVRPDGLLDPETLREALGGADAAGDPWR